MPIDSRISPHFTDEKYNTGSLEDLIDVLDDRVRFWLLAPAKVLLDAACGGPAALSLLLAYFEAHAIYLKGQDSHKRSQEFFRAGFLEVFRDSGPSEDLLGRVSDLLYVDARCGLFHEGMARDGIYIGKGKKPLLVTLPSANGKLDEDGPIQSVVIDPEKFWFAVGHHFHEYVRLLRDTTNTELRSNFKKAVDLKWRINEPGRIIGMTEEEFLGYCQG